MSRFKVGDAVRLKESRQIYEITSSYEGFCQAKLFQYTIHADIVPRYFMIDDLDQRYVSVAMPVQKFKLSQKVLFCDIEKHNPDFEPGSVTSILAEMVTIRGTLTPRYIYYVLPDSPTRAGRASVTQESFMRNITNTNSLWNELNDI